MHWAIHHYPYHYEQMVMTGGVFFNVQTHPCIIIIILIILIHIHWSVKCLLFRIIGSLFAKGQTAASRHASAQ
jgi:nucleoside permease NupC